MNPKCEIRPERSEVEKILAKGWVGQLKTHGHRAQIHVPADADAYPIVYNRQGTRHGRELTLAMETELFRLFRPEKGWNVIDAEWLKSEQKIFVFDFLKKDGEVLAGMTFLERFALLPRAFLSPHLAVLPLLKNVSTCLNALEEAVPLVEGLVFKSTNSCGFADSSVIRCRKRQD